MTPPPPLSPCLAASLWDSGYREGMDPLSGAMDEKELPVHPSGSEEVFFWVESGPCKAIFKAELEFNLRGNGECLYADISKIR